MSCKDLPVNRVSENKLRLPSQSHLVFQTFPSTILAELSACWVEYPLCLVPYEPAATACRQCHHAAARVSFLSTCNEESCPTACAHHADWLRKMPAHGCAREVLALMKIKSESYVSHKAGLLEASIQRAFTARCSLLVSRVRIFRCVAHALQVIRILSPGRMACFEAAAAALQIGQIMLDIRAIVIHSEFRCHAPRLYEVFHAGFYCLCT